MPTINIDQVPTIEGAVKGSEEEILALRFCDDLYRWFTQKVPRERWLRAVPNAPWVAPDDIRVLALEVRDLSKALVAARYDMVRRLAASGVKVSYRIEIRCDGRLLAGINAMKGSYELY